MHGPFPDELEPTFGSVTLRTIKGVPVWIVMLLLGAGIGPLLFLGLRSWMAWLVAGGCVTMAAVVASWAKDDPQFVSAWYSEIMLKRYYH